MTSEAQRQLVEETYTALGRFVVAFSSLLYALETSTVHLMNLGAGPHTILIEAALADRTASPIVNSFFSVFFKRWEDHLTPEDLDVMKCLRRELDEIVRKRNRIMHDAWLHITVGDHPGPHPMARYRLRAHGKGVDHEMVRQPPQDIAQLADDLERLATIVNAAVWYHSPAQVGPELDPRIQVNNGKVVLP